MTDWKLPLNAELKKIPTASAPYGDAITHRDYFWAVFVDGKIVTAGATKKAARAKYRRLRDGYGNPPAQYPYELSEPSRKFKKGP